LTCFTGCGYRPGMHLLRAGATVTVLVVSVAILAAAAPAASPPAPARLLVVSVTKGFRHDSIPELEAMFAAIGKETGAFAVDHARTDADVAAKMTRTGLAAYDGVVFASTTGDLPLPDREAFLAWIGEGHAFVGVHAATDTFPGYPAYIDMIGGQFLRHGEQARVDVKVRDAAHPATQGLEASFPVFDEIYQFQRHDPARVHLLLGLDRHPETGAPGAFSLAWTRDHGQGRVFYTALGHRPDVIASPWFRGHVRGGTLWALRRAAN
jgi:type 1 glutamine amidotransferase